MGVGNSAPIECTRSGILTRTRDYIIVCYYELFKLIPREFLDKNDQVVCKNKSRRSVSVNV